MRWSNAKNPQPLRRIQKVRGREGKFAGKWQKQHTYLFSVPPPNLQRKFKRSCPRKTLGKNQQKRRSIVLEDSLDKREALIRRGRSVVGKILGRDEQARRAGRRLSISRRAPRGRLPRELCIFAILCKGGRPRRCAWKAASIQGRGASSTGRPRLHIPTILHPNSTLISPRCQLPDIPCPTKHKHLNFLCIPHPSTFPSASHHRCRRPFHRVKGPPLPASASSVAPVSGQGSLSHEMKPLKHRMLEFQPKISLLNTVAIVLVSTQYPFISCG